MWSDLAKFCHFGKIVQIFGNFLSVISMCQTFEPTLENSVWFWANLRCCKWLKIGQTFSVSGHTGRERGRRQTERKKERKEQSGKWKWNGNVSFRTTIFKEGVWNGLICHCLEFVTPLSLSLSHSLTLSFSLCWRRIFWLKLQQDISRRKFNKCLFRFGPPNLESNSKFETIFDCQKTIFFVRWALPVYLNR